MKNEMTRRRMAGVAAAAGTGVLAACAPGQGQTQPSAGSGQPVTLTLWDREEASYQPFMDKWLPLFATKNPKITVRYEPRPPEWGAKITAAIIAGTPPDVAAVFGDWFRNMQEAKQVVDLDKYIKATKFDSEDFVPGLYRGMNWQNKQIGIPQYVNTNALYYNKDHFRKSGVTLPAENWTQQQFLDAAQKLSLGPPSQRTQWAFSTNFGFTSRAISLAWAGGAQYNDPKDYGIFTLNTAQTARAVQWVHDLPWKLRLAARTNDERGGVGLTESVLQTGTVSMMVEGTHILAEWKSKAQTDWDVAHLPRGQGGRGERTAMDGYVIPTGGKNPDAAWAALMGITDKEANKLRAEINGFVPARKSQFDIWAKSIPGKNLKLALPSDEAKPGPEALWPRTRDVSTAINPIWAALFDRNELSVQDALKQMQEAVVGILGPQAGGK